MIYITALVKLRIEPTVVLLSMRVDEGVNTHLDPEGRRRGSVNGDGASFKDLALLERLIIVCLSS